MRYDVDVNGTRRHVTVERKDGRLLVFSGERVWVAELAMAGANTVSLLLQSNADGPASAVESHEFVLAADAATGQSTVMIGGVPFSAGLSKRRRWGSKEDGAAGAGPQRIVAPMPGKVVRILARPGDPVQQRQAVVVIEAMKMENELRAAHSGTLSELLVREGQSVDAGTLLAIIAPQ